MSRVIFCGANYSKMERVVIVLDRRWKVSTSRYSRRPRNVTHPTGHIRLTGALTTVSLPAGISRMHKVTLSGIDRLNWGIRLSF